MNKEKRLSKFLSEYNFYSNNIDFRIVSSAALEKFKNVQSFQLSQLVNGRFFFRPERREILLLKYDLVTCLINEVEHMIIDHNSVDIKHVVKLVDKTNSVLKETIINNYENFDMCFVNLWTEIHDMSFSYYRELISIINTQYVEKFFVDFVDIIILFMEHTLIEIHELNNIFIMEQEDSNKCYNNLTKVNPIELRKCCNKKLNFQGIPTMYITDLSMNYFLEFGRSLVSHRINRFKGFLDFDTIKIKNVCRKELSHEFFEHIEEFAKIDYRGSLEDGI